MRRLLLVPVALAAVLAGGTVTIAKDQCGPFTDVTPAFCPYVLELYYLGITVGTSATTFSPDDPLTRGQAAVFIAKGLNQSLARSSRRAALGQWWTTTPHYDLGLGVTVIDQRPRMTAADGADIWVASLEGGAVSRVRSSDGKRIETWTGASGAFGVLTALGRVFVTGFTDPGALYAIDPSQPPGAVTTVASNLGNGATSIAFDGGRIWTANTTGGSVSIVTPGSTLPWSVTTPSAVFSVPLGIVFDGSSMWVSDPPAGALYRLDTDGAIVQTVAVSNPQFLAFDGANIWAPNFGDATVSIVQASTGTVVATLTGNGLDHPYGIAFDGDRVLVTNYSASSISVWRAADLAPLGSFPLGFKTFPYGACSDGVNFWITLFGTNQLARF